MRFFPVFWVLYTVCVLGMLGFCAVTSCTPQPAAAYFGQVH